MICPQCGTKTVLDWSRCPGCGGDPWTNSREVPGAATQEPGEQARRSRTRRILRFYAVRPLLPRLLLVVGTAQVAFVVLSNAVRVVGDAVRGEFLSSPFGWLYDLSVAATPGLCLIAIGEALVQLGRIADGLRKS